MIPSAPHELDESDVFEYVDHDFFRFICNEASERFGYFEYFPIQALVDYISEKYGPISQIHPDYKDGDWFGSDVEDVLDQNVNRGFMDFAQFRWLDGWTYFYAWVPSDWVPSSLLTDGL